jgi:phosphoribosylformimino-5-aminoimidazole carboxamide ribotide isomerase
VYYRQLQSDPPGGGEAADPHPAVIAGADRQSVWCQRLRHLAPGGAGAQPHPPGSRVDDLDAIQGRGNNLPIIEQLTRRFPSTVFWIDAGTSTLPMRKPSAGSLQPVLGSESLTDLSLLTLPCTETPGHPPIVSLDFLHDRLQGPPELLERTELWPKQLIVMSIDAIGAAIGPDYKRIEAIRHLAPEHDLFAAGGVSDLDDIERLAGLGVSGVLVASALHHGRIGLEEILATSISSHKPPSHPWD